MINHMTPYAWHAAKWVLVLFLLLATAGSAIRAARRTKHGRLYLASPVTPLLYGLAFVVTVTAFGALSLTAGIILLVLILAGLVWQTRPWEAGALSTVHRDLWDHARVGAGFAGGDARSAYRWARRRWLGWRFGEDDVPAAASVPVVTDAPPRYAPAPVNGRPVQLPGTLPNVTRRPEVRARNIAAGLTAIPAEWGGLVARTADFQAGNDTDLTGYMNDETGGIAAYAEAMVEQYEHNREVIGLDPRALDLLHAVSDALVGAAETMHAARQQYLTHYEPVDEFAAAGGQLAHDGRFHTGDVS